MSVRLLELADQLDADTLRQVFTHSSLVVERGRSYERFEFLGDSVLSLCITTELYRRFPSVSEGHLARLRAYIVSRATCCKVANRLGLGKMMRQHSSAGRDGNELAKKAQKNSEITEDDLKQMLDDIQKLTDDYIVAIDKDLAHKEKELMNV